MNKNIYIELADKLDSAGLFQESDDLLKVFSSSTSMIKTAQNSQLDKAIDKYSSLEAYHSFPSLMTLITAVSTVGISAARFFNIKQEIKEKYTKIEEKYLGDERIPEKTLDPFKIRDLEKAVNIAKDPLYQNVSKETITVHKPKPDTIYNPNDSSTFTSKKYIINEKIYDVTVTGNLTNEKPNPLAKNINPDFYLKDLEINGKVKLLKGGAIHSPVEKIDRDGLNKESKKVIGWGIAKIAALAGVTTIAELLVEERVYSYKLLPEIGKKIRVMVPIAKKKALADKTNQTYIAEKLRKDLEKLLEPCDGKADSFGNLDFLLRPKGKLFKEDFIDGVMTAFKTEIGYGKTSPSGSGTPNATSTNTSPTARPRTTPRNQPRPPAPSKPAQSPQRDRGGL